jgi:hypothetical protein
LASVFLYLRDKLSVFDSAATIFKRASSRPKVDKRNWANQAAMFQSEQQDSTSISIRKLVLGWDKV